MSAGADLRLRIDEKRHRGSRVVVALRDLSLSVRAGEFVALVGPSGCGKTSLLQIVAGLDRDFRGERAVAAARIGMVFQTPRLLPWRTVTENILLALPRPDRPLVEALLDEVGLADCAGAYPRQLSLGMQRRVAIARALAVDPDLLLLDEPFVSLDGTNAASLRDLVRRSVARRGATVLMVTHDLREAVALADRIVFLTDSPASVACEVEVTLPRRSPDAVEAFLRTLAV